MDASSRDMAEILGADLEQSALDPHPRRREGHLRLATRGPAATRPARPWRTSATFFRHSRLDRASSWSRTIARRLGERAEQLASVLDGATGKVADELRRLTRRLDPAQRRDDRSAQGRGVVVDEVAPDPRNARSASRGPLGQECRLPEARWGDDGDHRLVCTRAAGRRVRTLHLGRRQPVSDALRSLSVVAWCRAMLERRHARRGVPVPPHVSTLPPNRGRRPPAHQLFISRYLLQKGCSAGQPGRAPAAQPGGDVVPGRRPPGARGVGVHRRRRVEQGLHDAPGLLDPVLAAEPGAVARSWRRGAAPRTASRPRRPRRRTPCRARSGRSARGRYGGRRPGSGCPWRGRA